MKNIIKKINLPVSNKYYEKDSSDGYAFLASAFSNIGVDYSDLENIIKLKDMKLNAPQKILKANVSKENQYIYTLWTCFEFFSSINNKEMLDEIKKRVSSIGVYKDGWTRYCSEEINYVVPNVTSAMSLMSYYFGDADLSRSLISVLEESQNKGNWWYRVLPSNKNYRKEDPYHLAMIIYHLKELKSISDIPLDSIIDKAFKCLLESCQDDIPRGSIGWGVPMIYVVSKDIDKRVHSMASDILFKESLVHPNFRVRAMSAWALSKCAEVL